MNNPLAMPERPRTSDAADVPPSSATGGGGGVEAPSGRDRGDRSLRRSDKLRFRGSSPSQPRKRPRTTSRPMLSLEGALSEELLLRCLSFLSAHELATVSRVSSAWYRLAQDPQLWRGLYLRTFASASMRRQTASGVVIARTRPWRDLFRISMNWRNGAAKASSLGVSLRRAVLPEAPPLDEVPTVQSSPRETASSYEPALSTAQEDPADTLLQTIRNYIITASRAAFSLSHATELPLVTVHKTLPSGGTAVVGSFTSSRIAAFFAARPDFRPQLFITDLRIDESGDSPKPLIGVFFSTGQFSLFRLDLASASRPALPFAASEVYSSLALGSTLGYPFTTAAATSRSPFDQVTHARLHSPLLVTLSESMTLRLWRLCDGEGGELEVVEAQTPLQAQERWAPVALSLVPDAALSKRSSGLPTLHRGTCKTEGEQHFKVALAYSTPVFPSAWTVGLQEFLISVPPAYSDSASVMPSTRHLSALRVQARHASAPPAHTSLPLRPVRTTPLSGSHLSSAATTRSNPVTSIEYSHPFIVTSRVDNTLDVYEVSASPLSPPPTATTPSSPNLLQLRTARSKLPPLKLRHFRTLYGHTSRVASLALQSDNILEPVSHTGQHGTVSDAAISSVRCISAGEDGAVKVWHLTRADNSASPSLPSSGFTAKRRLDAPNGSQDFVVDVHVEASASDAGQTPWQRMKRRRLSGSRARGEAEASASTGIEGEAGTSRVRRVWVGDEAIFVAARTAAGGNEDVRVLRFD